MAAGTTLPSSPHTTPLLGSEFGRRKLANGVVVGANAHGAEAKELTVVVRVGLVVEVRAELGLAVGADALSFTVID